MSSTRFEYLKVILPGGVALGVVAASMRVVKAGLRDCCEDSASTIRSISQRIEDPSLALVVAFGIGLTLYLVDFGGSNPHYWHNIPSARVSDLIKTDKRLQGESPQNVYFAIRDEMMPESFEARAAWKTAIYRVGLQLSTLALLAAAIVPLVLVESFQATDFRAGVRERDFVPSLIAVVTFSAAITVASWSTPRGRSPSCSLVVSVLLGQLLVVLYWTELWDGLVLGRIAVVVPLAVWLFVKLRGPLLPALRSLFKAERVDILSDTDKVLLDTLPCVALLVGAQTVAPSLGAIESIVLHGIGAIGLAVTLSRNHEIGLQGNYRQQRAWIDRNFDRAKSAMFALEDEPADMEEHRND